MTVISCKIWAKTSLAKAASTLNLRLSLMISPSSVTHQTTMRALGESNWATRSSNVSENSWWVFASDDVDVSARTITPLLSTWRRNHYSDKCHQTWIQKMSNKSVLKIDMQELLITKPNLSTVTHAYWFNGHCPGKQWASHLRILFGQTKNLLYSSGNGKFQPRFLSKFLQFNRSSQQ